MASIETIRRITIEARTAGVEQANARLADTTRAIGTMEGAVARVRRAYDPLYSATERLTQVSRTLALAVASGNLAQEEANRLYDQASARILNVGRAMEAASRAQQQWNALSQAGRQQLQQVQAASSMSAANRSAVERLSGLSYSGGSSLSDAQKRAMAAQVDPLAAAQQKRDEQLAKADTALKAGAITQEQHARSVATTTATYVAQETAIRRFIQNTDASGKSAKLTAYELQNLGYQANDVFSSLASGITPMQTLAQQGPQIFQILQGSNGGLKGGLSALGGVALSAGRALVSFGGALGGAAAAMAAAAVAGNSYANSMLAVDRAVAGRGRASGSTAQQIIDAANANADAGNVTARQAREMAAEFASTGRIGSEMYGSLIRSAKDYAATTGQDLPSAQKALAEAFADPAKGAEVLNAQLGFLNSSTLKNIQNLAQQGDRLGAQRALMDAYSTGLTKARDLTSAWGQTTEFVLNNIAKGWDLVGKAVANSFTGGETPEARLAEARRLLNEAQGSQGGVVDRLTGNATGEVQRLQGVIASIQAQIAQRDAQNATARRAQRDLEIKAIVDGYNQSGLVLEKLEREAKNIAKALNEGVIDADGRSQRAMLALREAAAQLKQDMAAGGAAYADAVRAAGFENRNVGTTGVALQRARVEEDAQNKARAAVGSTQDASELFAKLQSIEIERVTKLNTLLKETENQAANAGGALARVGGSLREQIVGAARGAVTPNLIAGIASKESNFNPNIGFTKVLNAAGQPSTSAYGLGQITKGTAEEAINRGYLPQGFDRTNTETMAAGIAGVLQMKIDQAGGDVFKGLSNYYGSKDPAANRAYAADVMRRAGQFGDVSTEGLVKSQDALTRAQRDAEQANDNLAKNYGKNGEAAELAAARQQKYNELIDAGRPAAEAASIAFSGMTDKIVQLGRSGKEIQFNRDLDFEREQLGRSAADQSAFSRARSAFGDTTSGPAEAAIGRMRELDMMKEARGTFQDTFGGVVSSLSRGSTAAQAFSQALSRLGDKLINLGTDALGGALFGSLGKGSGGGFGGLLSGLFGGGKDVSGGLVTGDAADWFADGGVMTSRGALPLHRYATGGIANSPQVAVFGEGRGPEAFVPLPDGRRIPVAMTGAPANQPPGMTDARSYSFDLRGSNLNEAQVQAALTRAIAANNQEQYRTQAEQSETYRRMAG